MYSLYNDMQELYRKLTKPDGKGSNMTYKCGHLGFFYCFAPSKMDTRESDNLVSAMKDRYAIMYAK